MGCEVALLSNPGTFSLKPRTTDLAQKIILSRKQSRKDGASGPKPKTHSGVWTHDIARYRTRFAFLQHVTTQGASTPCWRAAPPAPAAPCVSQVHDMYMWFRATWCVVESQEGGGGDAGVHHEGNASP